MEGGTGAHGPTFFSDHYFLMTLYNLKTDNLNNFKIFTVKTLLEEILHIPRWGRGGQAGRGRGRDRR